MFMGGLRVHSVTILRRHYFGVFQGTKKRNPINKGFQLLRYLKIPQFPYSIAEVGLTQFIKQTPIKTFQPYFAFYVFCEIRNRV